MDGAVGITQCAVGPGRAFIYKFQIGQQQHGTFWYHAHSAVQRADGMYGGLVVHKPVGTQRKSDLSVHGYDSEKLLLIGDWYHRSADRVLAEYKDFRSFANEVSSQVLRGICLLATKPRVARSRLALDQRGWLLQLQQRPSRETSRLHEYRNSCGACSS